VLAIAALAVSACEVVSKDSRAKQDTSTVATTQGVSAGSVPGAADTTGVPAVPDSARQTPDSAARAADSAAFELAPDRPERGGVLFALARGVAGQAPRCTWKSAPLPCYAAPGGLLLTVPLPADEPGGTYTLVIERPGGRIVREVTVAERDLGQQLVFLDDSLYALVRRTGDVARDARALHRVLAGESDRRLWSGRWREPITGARSSGYGVERFYFRASDSSRAITLGPRMRASGSFGADTAPAGDVPGWRHAGVDIAARHGAAVAAPAAGAVAEIGEYILTGRTLVLDHGQGVLSAYFHLDTVLVRKGDVVPAGRTIARVGSTGLATGPHLHYGIYVHGKDVDPAAWRAMPDFARADTMRTARR
jgi:hypothetical protein